MTSTVNGLVVLVFVLIPGVPAEAAYNLITGSDWREERFQRVIRIVLLSVLGLVTCAVIAGVFIKAWIPKYVMPAIYDAPWNRELLVEMSGAYLGHTLTSLVFGFVFAGISKISAHLMGQTVYPSAWDDLLRSHTRNHWIIVSLSTGEAYAGILETADQEVPSEERDVLLKEPASYSAKKGNYFTLPYQHLFIPSALIDSVAVVYDDDADEHDRLTEINEPLFEVETDE